MSGKLINDSGKEGLCPKCHHKMSVVSPQNFNCPHCKQHYLEQYICPTCLQKAQMIKGCGAVNYICPTDGLISSSKVIFHYLPE
ncbi:MULTISPECIES: YfgJ family double zinc ribbon protein [unclassified Gilliamella]|uniref:YfgJ family double zinc ribbon protein n=1 Tax=unclassified Gilliamella TaxID=2685620 RepID=UPI0009BEFCFF|nr:zinc-ribbon domain-containing protein [Gilliamella apicola]